MNEEYHISECSKPLLELGYNTAAECECTAPEHSKSRRPSHLGFVISSHVPLEARLQDDGKLAKAAGKLFDACDRGNVVIVLLPAVLAECVFVLESFYEHPRKVIASALTTLISSPGIEINNAAINFDALDRYRKTKVHFVDCLIAATASAHDVPVATFDQDFRKFADVRVQVE